MNRIILLVGVAILCVCKTNNILANNKINFVKEITIDGNASDWENQGSCFNVISDKYGAIDIADFHYDLKIGWNNKGLFFMAEVVDDIMQNKYEVRKGGRDMLEIFVSLEKGSDQMVQYLISNLFHAKDADFDVDKFDYMQGVPFPNVKEIDIALKDKVDGYTIEIFIPNDRIGKDLSKEMPLFVNVSFKDCDNEEINAYPLFINDNTYGNHNSLRGFSLSEDKNENTESVITRAKLIDKDKVVVQLTSKDKKSNISSKIEFEGKEYASSNWEEKDGYSICELTFNRSDISMPQTGFDIIEGDNKSSYYFREVPMRFENIKIKNGYEPTICMFEEMDKVNPPPKDPVLFIGSSTIRLWRSLKEDFPEHHVIRRGFGGSKTTDALYYFDRIVTPYKPKTVVFFSGNNDINRGTPPQEICDNFEKFITEVKAKLPDTKVVVLSIKVSISRKETTPTVLETNKLLQKMVEKHSNAVYVDVVSVMMDKKGEIDRSIFSADGTHMNSKGYSLWSDIVRKYL